MASGYQNVQCLAEEKAFSCYCVQKADLCWMWEAFCRASGTDFAAEDIWISYLSHFWMQTDSRTEAMSEMIQNLHNTIIYGGNEENTALDASKIHAVLMDYTLDGVSDDFTTQPAIAELT